MEVGIRKRAWQRDWRYPAYLWSLRWVYAVKRTREVCIRRIPAYTTGPGAEPLVGGAKPPWSWKHFGHWMFNGAGKFSPFLKMHLYFYSRCNGNDMGKICRNPGGSGDPPCPFLGAPMTLRNFERSYHLSYWHWLNLNLDTEFIVHIDTIRYDRPTRCYFNVRSKADISQLNLPHGTDN